LSILGGQSNNPRFSSWGSNADDWYQDGKSWQCKYAGNVCVSSTCVPRQSLTLGRIDGRSIEYTFLVDKLGEWKIYAFLYEEQYKMRDYSRQSGYSPFQNTDIEKRAIAFTQSQINVVNEKPSNFDKDKFTFRQALAVTLAFLGYASLVLWLYVPIKRFYLKYKNQILIVTILSILVFFISRYSCKLSFIW
jgi:hypothetical protein